ncbi:MAG TPA: DUF3105 domain-containing protein [Solirubrobacterales bacterium]|nr:DUF3105 domain-containing protein [Solirubrobacterales bacterium]
MANRREEERERLRQARQEREEKQAGSDKRRLMIGYGVAGLVGLLVVAGIVAVIVSGASKNDSGNAHISQQSGSTNGIQPDTRSGTTVAAVKVTDLKEAARKAGCDLRLRLPEEGHNHIPPTAATPEYKTNPPTSGNHVEPPYQQADGAYREMPKEIDMVHSLEHGRIEFQYSPDLSESEQLELIGMYDTLFGAALLFPNENMPYAVAATGWRSLIGCNEFKGAITLDALRDFAKQRWGHGREGAMGFPFTGPTAAEPTVN